jgi:hypothetical protein
MVSRLSQQRHQGQAQSTEGITVPAPLGGINNAVPLALMPVTDTVMTVNMQSSAYGLRVRPGYTQWCEPIPDGDGVKTIIPFNASGRLNVGDKLFAVTNDGIYNISVQGGTPAKVVDFLDKGVDAGWCSWHNFTNTAGAQFLLVCDLINGYYIYDGAANTWTKIVEGTNPGTINGADPDSFCFVTVWKNRVWFVERDSTRGYYLETVGIATGKVVPFDFGSKMRYGGFLKGLYSWTLDAGMGVDDHLVAVSSEGDVLVYTGTDPTTAGQFGMRGVWFIGETPRGRRGASDFGGDLLVGSQFGLVPLSRLVQGVSDPNQLYMTSKIQPLYRNRYELRKDDFGFEIKFIPSEGLVLVVWPEIENQRDIQLAYDATTQSWTVWADIPMLTVEHYRGQTYFGTRSNDVYFLTRTADGVMLDPEIDPNPISFSMLTAFSDLGMPAKFKRVQFLHPIFIADTVPVYGIEARYDYDVSGEIVVPPLDPSQLSLWDDAFWDDGVWASGYQIDQPVRGAVGMGRTVAIAIGGSSNGGETTLAAFDMMVDAGGLL